MCDVCEDDNEDANVGDGEEEYDGAGGDGDDVDAAAVDASIERHVLSPLRRTRGSSGVPSGLLTRQQAWALAHASDYFATTDGEMVDPWDADDDADGAAALADTPETPAHMVALRAAESAARTEYTRLWKLRSTSGKAPMHLEERLAAAKERVRTAAMAVLAAT